MRIGIHTWGSEGDIRPVLALAEGLVAAGHEVRVAYSAADGRDYAAHLAGAKYECLRLASPLAPEALRRIGSEIFADPVELRQIWRVIRDLLEPMIAAMLQSARELASWADVLVLHPFAHPLAAAAELEGKPFVCLYLAPLIGTREFPPSGRLPDIGALNALNWALGRAAISRCLLRSMNEVRTRLRLPPIKRAWQQLDRSVIDIVAVSPTLLPRPGDWCKKVHLSGSLSPQHEPRAATLSAEVEAFLAAGPAPVYITFGSMARLEKNPSELMDQVERSVAMTGCRAIVQSEVASRASGPASPRVLRVGAMAHDEVFPRCAAIVHHGGAGTTQAALRAGRPSVVVAHISDQFLWGLRLHRLGVAPSFLLRRGLKVKSLARAIEQVTQDTAMAAEAERLGRLMSRENGLRRAVELIGQLQPACVPATVDAGVSLLED